MKAINEEKWPIITNKKDAQKLPGSMILCNHCNNIIIERIDPHHGEIFCEACGTIDKRIAVHYDEEGNFQEFEFEETIYNNDNSESLTEGKIEILVDEEDLKKEVENGKFKRIEWLHKKYDRKHEGNKKSWRLNQYKTYIGIVTTHFNLNNHQKQRVYDFIKDLNNLNKLNRQRSYEQIITAICIHVLRKDGEKIYFTDKNLTKVQKGFLDEIKLNERVYFSIIEKAVKI